MHLILLFGSGLSDASDMDRPSEVGLFVHRADENGVSFEYMVPDIEEMNLVLNGQGYQMVRLSDCGFTDQIGAPQLPRLRLLVGVPLGAGVEVILHDAQFEERNNYQIVPVPKLVRHPESDDAFAREEFIPDPEFYTTDALYPERVIEIEEPSFLRNQLVAGIILHPVQYNPVTGMLRIFSKLSVGVSFKGRHAEPYQPRGQSRDLFEGVYQKTLINYEVAKEWRRRPSVRRMKGSIFQGEEDWYKVKVKEDGLYALDSYILSDVGIDVSSLDPRTIRMFSGDGRELPTEVSASRSDSLTEIAIAVKGEEDGSFDTDDAILFYGRSLSGWEYDPDEDMYAHYFHHYTNDNIYWLTLGSQGVWGKRMASKDGSLSSPNPLSLFGFHDRVHEEREVANPFNSGLTWFWRTFSGETWSFRTELPGAISDSVCTVTVRMRGKTTGELGVHEVKVFFNDHLVEHATFYSERELLIQEDGIGWVKDGDNELRVEHRGHSGSDPSVVDQIYFDWYEIRYWRRLEAHDGELEFSGTRGLNAVEFELTGFSGASVTIYDITDPFNVITMENATGGETIRFQDLPDPSVERRYRAVNPERIKKPVDIVKAEPLSLRDSANGADYLIVTHKDFVEDVEPLREHRQTVNGFATRVVVTTAIYDEFSWGLFDPTAIRDFLKYVSENWNLQPAYVLFVGDGNYDYKNYSLTSPGNWIPPYERGSDTYDDWYVYLDGDLVPDMFVGRLPAQSRQQVRTIVEKIIAYDVRPQLGPWRNRVLLLADDELVHCEEISWNTVHTTDSEILSRSSIPRNFEQSKIYLMEYELDQSCEKPTATEGLLTQLNTGVTLFNYIGHGGYNVMADEDAFRSSRDLPKLRNEGMPFLLAAFTCDLGVFDHPRDESMAEDLVRLAGRGAVATIAAARGTSSGPNLDLNRRFFTNLFLGDVGFGTVSTFGEALVAAKATVSSPANSQLYLLFGDPAQRLSVPRYEVVTTRLQPDTLQALRVITLDGEIVKTDGSVIRDFDGRALVNVCDSYRNVTHITPDGQKEVHYQLPGAVIFRGSVSVVDGTFQTQFVIPKDISYGGVGGRISLYVSNDSYDGVGYRDSLVTGGGAIEAVDSIGPVIDMTIKGREETFAEGDYVQPGEILKISFFDSSGINITGETGHWIVLQTDGDSRTRQDITPYFFYEEGNYQKGTIEYEMSSLSAGDHALEIKAWDNYNNASVQSLFLRVASADDFRILNVLNYPNPFIRETTFTYELTQPANDVIIKIYTVAGRLVKTISAPGDLGFNQSTWEAVDEDGDRVANGLYLYKVIASGIDGQRHEYIGRLVIMR